MTLKIQAPITEFNDLLFPVAMMAVIFDLFEMGLIWVWYPHWQVKKFVTGIEIEGRKRKKRDLRLLQETLQTNHVFHNYILEVNFRFLTKINISIIYLVKVQIYTLLIEMSIHCMLTLRCHYKT